MPSQQERYYNALWSRSKVVDPSAWALWKTVNSYIEGKSHLLEVGAGNRPRIPVSGSYFVDLSPRAMEALRERDGLCAAGSAGDLPFPDEAFDLICAFEIVEHVPDGRAVLQEMARVLKNGERLIFSVPLHMEYWSKYDELAGHVLRYDPALLESLLAGSAMPVEKYCVTFSPRNRWYRNATASLASRFWEIGVALESGLARPFYCWLDRLNGIKWQEGAFVEHTRRANNVIVVCRKRS